MKLHLKANLSTRNLNLDSRVATYLTAAGAVTAVMASEAKAIVVGKNLAQPFGINGEVRIDFNLDGQTDFSIDHDRVDLTAQSGTIVDYLQIDKNDINGETNPLVFDPGSDTTYTAPFQDGITPRNDADEAAYVIAGPQGSYPAALTAGTSIGPASTFDWQEGGNFQSSGKDIRANRLIDEDATQIDQILGGQPPTGVYVPTNGPNFIGLGGEVRYIGVKMDLNNLNTQATPVGFNYGWIGIRITDEASATGEVVGWAYETNGGVIRAGQVPEPGTILTSLIGGGMLVGCVLWRRLFGRS